MRIRPLVLVVATSLSIVAAPAAPAAEDRPVLNVGHRGASALAPEHTIAAYDLALELGADYIEQDLQMTSDGVLVVVHDPTLDRTARGPAENCTGAVATKTLAQIKTCDVGSWFNEAYPKRARPRYEGLRIPTLEQVFRRYGRTVNYYVETKNPELGPQMEEELLRLLDEYGLTKPAERRRKVLIQSFQPESLLRIHAQAPALPLIQLMPTASSEGAELDAIAEYAVGVGPSAGSVDDDFVAAAHERGLDVHPYTVDARAEMTRLIELGVDGMFTNRPARLEAVLRTRAA